MKEPAEEPEEEMPARVDADWDYADWEPDRTWLEWLDECFEDFVAWITMDDRR